MTSLARLRLLLLFLPRQYIVKKLQNLCRLSFGSRNTVGKDYVVGTPISGSSAHYFGDIYLSFSKRGCANWSVSMHAPAQWTLAL